MKIARKAVAAEPPRPVVRRVARVAEPPIIPVEPAAPEPEAEPVAETLPVPYVARTEEPRRGIFRRFLDRLRDDDDDTPDDSDTPDAEAAELPEDASVVEPGDSAPTLSRTAARAAGPTGAERQPQRGAGRAAPKPERHGPDPEPQRRVRAGREPQRRTRGAARRRDAQPQPRTDRRPDPQSVLRRRADARRRRLRPERRPTTLPRRQAARR